MLLPFETWEHLWNTHTNIIEFLDGDTKLSSCNPFYRLRALIAVELKSYIAILTPPKHKK